MFFKNYDAKIECAEHRCKQKSTNLSHFPDENGLNDSQIFFSVFCKAAWVFLFCGL